MSQITAYHRARPCRAINEEPKKKKKKSGANTFNALKTRRIHEIESTVDDDANITVLCVV